MALFDVISHDNVGDCKYILERDPTAVNATGWHGMTPLHRAVTKGNFEILETLLRFGPDVNQVNAFGETPLHYACQTASLRFLNVLVENGADLAKVDNGGKTCIHHAARSGSVWKIEYLVALGLDLGKRDIRGQTVYHIAAEYGHIDLTEYCLRNKRFDPGVTDNSLMTPLHIAALNRNRKCAWIIESSSSKTLINVPDVHGNTPVDYADQGITLEHKWLSSHLQYWQKTRIAGFRPKPWLEWSFLLLTPSMLILGISYCLHHFTRIGWLLSIGLFAGFYVFALTGHRLRHISSLPSPAFFGLFFGGIVQSMLCYLFYLGPPNLWPELLWNSLALCVFIALLIALKKLYSDPGAVRNPKLKENGQPYTIIDVAKGILPMDDFCIDCEMVTPVLSKHCKLCNHCVLAIDHHCLFLMWCVAVNNHRVFIVVMVEVMLSQVLFIRASYTYLNSLVQLKGFPASFRDAIGQEVYVSTLLFLNCLGFFWVLMLALYQIKIVSEGATSYYTPDGSPKTHVRLKEMFRSGKMSYFLRARNIVHFFLGEYTFYKNKQREMSV